MFLDASLPNSHPFSTSFDFHRIVPQPPHTEWCASYVGAACEHRTALQRQQRWLATLVEWLAVRCPSSTVREVGRPQRSGQREQQEEQAVDLATLGLSTPSWAPVGAECRRSGVAPRAEVRQIEVRRLTCWP